jgi:hypothetical protein
MDVRENRQRHHIKMAKLAPTRNDVWSILGACSFISHSSNHQCSGSCSPVRASPANVKRNGRIVMQDHIDYQLVARLTKYQMRERRHFYIRRCYQILAELTLDVQDAQCQPTPLGTSFSMLLRSERPPCRHSFNNSGSSKFRSAS